MTSKLLLTALTLALICSKWLGKTQVENLKEWHLFFWKNHWLYVFNAIHNNTHTYIFKKIVHQDRLLVDGSLCMKRRESAVHNPRKREEERGAQREGEEDCNSASSLDHLTFLIRCPSRWRIERKGEEGTRTRRAKRPWQYSNRLSLRYPIRAHL